MEFNLSSGLLAQEKNIHLLDSEKIYDVLILGGGPAGLSAAVYTIRKGLSTGIIAGEIGGQVNDTTGVENYIGFKFINGVDLVGKFREQVIEFGIDMKEEITVESMKDGKIKEVIATDGKTYRAHSLLIASGKRSRKLEVPGEERLAGRGVAYCATCDAPFFRDKKVVVVGGGNSGIESAIDLAALATEVTVIQFLDHLTADKVLVDKLNSFDNVQYIYNSEVTEISGENQVEAIHYRNRDTAEVSQVAADGIFVEIGLIPNSSFASGIVDMTPTGEIIVDCACKTSAPGIFAAGDVTTVPFKQIVVAAGEGAKAALSASDYIMKHT